MYIFQPPAGFIYSTGDLHLNISSDKSLWLVGCWSGQKLAQKSFAHFFLLWFLWVLGDPLASVSFPPSLLGTGNVVILWWAYVTRAAAGGNRWSYEDISSSYNQVWRLCQLSMYRYYYPFQWSAYGCPDRHRSPLFYVQYGKRITQNIKNIYWAPEVKIRSSYGSD